MLATDDDACRARRRAAEQRRRGGRRERRVMLSPEVSDAAERLTGRRGREAFTALIVRLLEAEANR